MPGKISTKIIWEDNPDTSITATNLSKSLDIVSDSKFIEYTESASDYESWADIVIPDERIATIADNNKVVYVKNTGTFIKGRVVGNIASWIYSGFPIPTKKLLKIKENTKISMKYKTTSNVLKYQNFDTGENITLFSVESLVVGEYFSPNMIYNIYLYNSASLGDYAQIKIVSEYDDDNNTGGWKQGLPDISSPTGSKVISIRKIGGFKTGTNSDIISDSLWDLSVYKSEIITEKYKIMDSSGVRNLMAIDIPISDPTNVFVSENVQNTLEDIKTNVDRFYEDMYYTDDRYGVELQYSIFTKNGSSLAIIDINGGSNIIPLRITPGYINISGRRVKISQPIYLGDKSLGVKINNYSRDLITNVELGAISQFPYSDTTPTQTLYPGLWRVYINSDGIIIYREGDNYIPKYLSDTSRKGWYYTPDSSRCIGKFRVRSDGAPFLEKMSITNTFESNVGKNSIHIFHGAMCPDGLFPCDGKWHDINGYSSSIYSDMPNPTGIAWANSWWEQTPNMFGRTIKMFDENAFAPISPMTIELAVPQPRFSWIASSDPRDVIVTGGSSESCGQTGGQNSHLHNMTHQHNANGEGGDIRITSSAGSHGHIETYMSINQSNDNTEYVVKYSGNEQGSHVSVSTSLHKHTGSIIDSGQHGHETGSFVGQTGTPRPSNTAETTSWSPYKEFMICIKK